MARFIFNQEVKHEANRWVEGDVATLDDELADYFASNSWGYIEGVDVYEGDPIINPELPPTPPVDIVLEIDNSVIGTEDSNNG